MSGVPMGLPNLDPFSFVQYSKTTTRESDAAIADYLKPIEPTVEDLQRRLDEAKLREAAKRDDALIKQTLREIYETAFDRALAEFERRHGGRLVQPKADWQRERRAFVGDAA